MICETLFGLATTISIQIAHAHEYQRVIQIEVEKEHLQDARYYVNTQVPGYAGFIKNGKLYVVRYLE